MAGEEPMIARPDSQNSLDDSHSIEEEDALLTGRRTNKQISLSVKDKKRKWREILLFTWAMLATAVVVVLAVVYQHSQVERGNEDGGESPLFALDVSPC